MYPGEAGECQFRKYSGTSGCQGSLVYRPELNKFELPSCSREIGTCISTDFQITYLERGNTIGPLDRGAEKCIRHDVVIF